MTINSALRIIQIIKGYKAQPQDGVFDNAKIVFTYRFNEYTLYLLLYQYPKSIIVNYIFFFCSKIFVNSIYEFARQVLNFHKLHTKVTIASLRETDEILASELIITKMRENMLFLPFKTHVTP